MFFEEDKPEVEMMKKVKPASHIAEHVYKSNENNFVPSFPFLFF